jgi:gamma-glutamyl-gamma-aminobutyrate hydrolase PuuD
LIGPYTKHGYNYQGSYDLEGLITRQEKFTQPPQTVIDELSRDNITDKWEVDCLTSPSANCTFDKKPIIGIMTQPVSTDKKDSFNYDDYILEINDNFVRWAGSKTVAIPYDISEEDLTAMLRQINGVLFTGGGLKLIDPDTQEQHTYYKTAKRVYQYSKYMTDVKNQTWPVLGICQGLEVISLIASGDDTTVLDEIFMYGENRQVSWAENSTDSQLWGTFPTYLRDAMEEHRLALHAHSYSVSMPTFDRISKMGDLLTVT